MVCLHISNGQQPEAVLNQTPCTCCDPCKACNKQVPVQNQGSSEYGTSDDDDRDSNTSSEEETVSEVSDDEDTDLRKLPGVQSEVQEVLDGNPSVRDNGENLQRMRPSMVTHNIYTPPRNNENPYTLLPVAVDNAKPSGRGAQV